MTGGIENVTGYAEYQAQRLELKDRILVAATVGEGPETETDTGQE